VDFTVTLEAKDFEGDGVKENIMWSIVKLGFYSKVK